MNSVPEPYLGVWRRRLLTTTDGRRDETSDVYWLQTAQLHADIRIPHPPTASASLATCSQAQQLDLCEQAGFAGLTLVEGDICQWQRLIDYQPPGAAPDIGRMRFEGADQLLEDGLDGRYHEVWQRVPERGWQSPARTGRPRRAGKTARTVGLRNFLRPPTQRCDALDDQPLNPARTCR
jgi:hypothetical protein